MAVLLQWMRRTWLKVKPHAVLEPSSEGQLPRMAVVAGFSRYAVTEDGQIINRKTRRVLRQYLNNCGYSFVRITDDTGKQRGQRVHRIVLAAFTPNPQGYPDSHHIDSDKSNNHRLNLQWVTRQQNMLHMRDFVSSRPDSPYRLTMADAAAIRERYAEGCRQAELAEDYGVHVSTVSNVVRNRCWHDPNYSPPIVNGRLRRQDNQTIQPATAETTEGEDDGSTSDL